MIIIQCHPMNQVTSTPTTAFSLNHRPLNWFTYNPAQTKIPVNTPFCVAVVLSRQSRGIGYATINTARSSEPTYSDLQAL